MRRIIECLLEEGILEEDIHRILDLIEEEYEIVDEGKNLKNVIDRASDKNILKAYNTNQGIHGAKYDPEEIRKDLEDKTDSTPDSESYLVTSRSGNGSHNKFFKGTYRGSTNNPNVVDRKFFSQEERQANKAKGRHYRKLQKKNK